ncbi:PD-(D/E)XK nuclease family protein, partial [Gemella sp. GH3]|uniref:PD-(D/E)XK nuclease family protein n=1 Tax=unclassified Gemella TaxID=2624949 RepID=UPI0015D08620
VDRVLVDEIYDDDIVYHNSYMEYLKEVYEFFLSTENKQKYLEYNKSFSNFSSSKVKDYVKSPYIFFVKRVLGIFQEENYEITPFNKGNFYHAVMEDSRILEYVAKQGELLANLDEIDQFDENKYLIPVRSLLLEVINNTINDNIVDFMTIINSKKMNYYEFNTIINRLTKLIIYEIYYTAISGYKATEVEKNFEFTITGDKIIYKDDDKEKFINLPRIYNIPTISFRGKIDRIDQKDNKYLLIDYKSSKSDFEYSKFYNGEDSQLLTYLIATILLKDIKIEQVLGIFYRQITEDKSNVRLKGLVNQDVLLGEDFARSASKIMFAGITKENKVNGHYKNRTLTSSEFEKFVKINIDNILTTIEKIYSFDYSALNKETELQELYDYSKNKLNSDDNNKSVGNTAQVKKLLLEKDL